MAGVRLERVSCTFRARGDEVRAVSDLDLCIADKELVVLVGPSGCGKTTTLRLIAGLQDPTSGVIRIGDRVVNRVAPRDRDVAMVFQNHALYPHMTVFKNMAFGLKMRRVPQAEIRRKVDETAAKLGMTHLLERRPAALSGGEKQRVALGRAIVRKPAVFLFDEPLSNLDPSLRLQMRAELKALHLELQTTMIHVTHDQEEAMTLGTRIAVMKHGVLQQFDAPLEVYRRPANRFVAGFIGAPPMNFFPGELRSDGKELFFVGRTHRIALPASISMSLTSFRGPVVLGIRPHHVHLSENPQDPSLASLGKAGVHLIEPLGDCANIHLLTSAGDKLLARTSPANTYHVGQQVTVRFDLRQLHVFAADAAGGRLH